MERIVMNPSQDQSISRQPSNRRAHYQSAPVGFRGGILHAPPRSLSFPHPPPVYHLNPPLPQQQPPLLPLPTHKLNNSNNNPLNRGLSCPPVNRKVNNRRGQKRSSVSPKKSDLKPSGQAKPSGPDPRELPKDVQSIFDSGLLSTISPPPSSLPLPTFFLRPKGSCKVEAAAGVNPGATDDLRRLLRLR